MILRAYDPACDAAAALALWERSLGAMYPVTRKAFLARVGEGASYWDARDALVAEENGAMVGFGSLEILRGANVTPTNASVSALMVDPAHARRGIGSRILAELEARAKGVGCNKIAIGQSRYRFFTGVPEDLTAAIAFFGKHGYVTGQRAPDMVIDCRPGVLAPQYVKRLAEQGARVERCTKETLPAVLEFMKAGWLETAIDIVAAGDMDNVLAVFHGSEVIGSLVTCTPDSRFASTGLVWQRMFAGRLGGYGEVMIAPSWRGKGLGAAMSEAAALHVQSRGAESCIISWVGPADFYRKIGATVWRWHEMFSKTL